MPWLPGAGKAREVEENETRCRSGVVDAYLDPHRVSCEFVTVDVSRLS